MNRLQYVLSILMLAIFACSSAAPDTENWWKTNDQILHEQGFFYYDDTSPCVHGPCRSYFHPDEALFFFIHSDGVVEAVIPLVDGETVEDEQLAIAMDALTEMFPVEVISNLSHQVDMVVRTHEQQTAEYGSYTLATYHVVTELDGETYVQVSIQIYPTSSLSPTSSG